MNWHVSPENEGAAPLTRKGESRRRFLIDAGLAAGGVAASPHLFAADSGVPELQAKGVVPANLVRTRLVVNGESRELRLDPRVTLLDALREQLRLTGTKKGCDRGQCGACTVLVNGRRVNACLSLVASHDGDEVTTVEGLGSPAAMHPVQRAFVKYDAYQCGYCTPGQVCSAVAAIAEAQAGEASAATADVRELGPIKLTGDEIRERMSGNICRCGAYCNIVEAVRSAAKDA